MPRTSDKAQRILEYVNQFVQENGYAPSVREIGAAVGLRSTASVSYHIQALQDKGLLLSPGAKGRKRSIVTNIRPGQIPVVGVVTAGVPILAVENFEGYVDLPWNSAKYSSDELFALKVKGESMIEAGIFDGDVVIVRKCTYAENGQIVVALIEDEATVKTFYKEDGHFRLQPENKTMEAIIVDEVALLGRVVASFRQYE